MRLYRTTNGPVLETSGVYHHLPETWGELINHPDLHSHLDAAAKGSGDERLDEQILAPIGVQEVWAAGVTYFRSRAARIEESKDTGGGTFYDRVYEAERPELFFKSPGWRVRGPGAPVRVRGDSRWTVPEPELALCVNARREIVGYTIGNDMSARDIEGENPLYLPQAKIYDGSCALGPALRIGSDPPPPSTPIRLQITRDGNVAFSGETTIDQMRRKPAELVEWLYREAAFPQGCVLLTGTGIVPPDDLTLQSGDEITIEIESVGELRNPVE